MISLGYKLSSEEHGPADLVRFAQMAEDAGFDFALISDHFHPWIDKQGQSPFVWSVVGAIAQATQPHQKGFFEMYSQEIIPRLKGKRTARGETGARRASSRKR